MYKFLNEIISYKSTINNLITLFVAIIALLISITSLRVSERQLEISDPASSIFINNIYFDITERLSNVLWGIESYDYPIVIEVYNTGNQPIVITGFTIDTENESLISSITTRLDRKSPRIYYSHNKAVAQDARLIDPIILEPSKNALIRSENSINFTTTSNFITSFDRNDITTYLPRYSENQSPISGWRKGAEFSVESLNLRISETIGSSIIKLNLSFLNKKALYILKVPLNDGNNGSNKENKNKINFDQFLLDEVLISDIKFIIERDSILTPIYSEITDSKGIESIRKSYSPDSTRMQESIEPLLKRMGFDYKLIYYFAGGSALIENWNPRIVSKKEVDEQQN